MKRNDGEPTYTLILGSCPEAVKNQDTDEPVDKKRLYPSKIEAGASMRAKVHPRTP